MSSFKVLYGFRHQEEYSPRDYLTTSDSRNLFKRTILLLMVREGTATSGVGPQLQQTLSPAPMTTFSNCSESAFFTYHSHLAPSGEVTQVSVFSAKQH